MKKLLLALIITGFSLNVCQAQSNQAFTFLSHWDDDALPIASPGNLNLQYSGCWGLAVNGHEYAVLGGARHVLFFDVTEPTTPKLVGKYEGTYTTVWREFKSYKNRIYAVSDATTEGLMIFDLSHAEDTIVRTYWSNQLFDKAHTITLDTVSGRIYLNGGDATQGIIVLDVSQNPDLPTFITHAIFQGGGLHDSYVRNDTIYASSGNEGYYIYDMKDPLNPVLLAEISTGGYNHNSWLNTAGTHAYYTEEIPAGRPVQIVDLQNLALGEIEIAGSFLDKFSVDAADKTAIAHNVYIRDNILFNSQYEDGLIAYDISNPTQPVLLAQYDTHPENATYTGYFGNWGNYPWLPSGNIIAGDMQNGLYMLKLGTVSVGTNSPDSQLDIQISPNPAHDLLNIRLQTVSAGEWSWTLRNTAGQMVSNGMEALPETSLHLAGLVQGLYFVEIRDEEGKTAVRKVVVE
ncbi:MAG: choice-of-anchor B family protein [Saprospiraceae bacterium]|nr:choice-of-anchor B family protein [Saprospiraceae bacterium]